jgi:hypothetical protein
MAFTLRRLAIACCLLAACDEASTPSPSNNSVADAGDAGGALTDATASETSTTTDEPDATTCSYEPDATTCPSTPKDGGSSTAKGTVDESKLGGPCFADASTGCATDEYCVSFAGVDPAYNTPRCTSASVRARAMCE